MSENLRKFVTDVSSY